MFLAILLHSEIRRWASGRKRKIVNEMKRKKRAVWVLNRHHVRVKKCCAACQLKEVNEEGKRICSCMQLVVEPDFRCPLWQMSDSLQNAGLAHGVVRKLTEVVIK